MKTLQKSFQAPIFLCLIVVSLLATGCNDNCTDTRSYKYYEPVYTSLATIRSSVKLDEPQPIVAVGKIYYKGGYLYVNEPGKGIHVIDNRDPASPVVKNFITIPGNVDIAIRNSILYADSYIDLVAIDISNPDQIQEVARMENIFSGFNSFGFYADVERGVVTEWVEKDMVDVEECNEQRQWWGGYVFESGVAFMDGSSPNSVGNSNGIGGSMARFTIANDFLYAVNGASLHAFDIQEPATPEKKSDQVVAWDIETIFPYAGNLFIGASSGMHIYGLTDPANPNKITTYTHITSCDPVVVEGEYAYVTLRSGTECNGFTNQLEVLDISTLSEPELLKVYPMNNPHGLGIDNNVLFICDGSAGLKIYDATDKLTISDNLIKHYDNIHAYDVIPFNNVLMLIGEDGILQYDYSDLQNIRLLSHINLANAE